MYIRLKLLKFDDVYLYFLIKFLRKALLYDESLLDKYFNDHFPTHSYTTRGNKINIPHIRTEIERHSPIYQAIVMYNTLPPVLFENMSDFKFKKIFKEYCFNKYRNY